MFDGDFAWFCMSLPWKRCLVHIRSLNLLLFRKTAVGRSGTWVKQFATVAFLPWEILMAAFGRRRTLRCWEIPLSTMGAGFHVASLRCLIRRALAESVQLHASSVFHIKCIDSLSRSERFNMGSRCVVEDTILRFDWYSPTTCNKL